MGWSFIRPTFNDAKSIKFGQSEWCSSGVFIGIVGEKSWADGALAQPTALFARSIVKPIQRLTMAAHALKSGDYDKATIKVTSGDEIGKLARTFNVMIDVLRQREREQKRKDFGRKKDLEERE